VSVALFGVSHSETYFKYLLLLTIMALFT